MSALLLVAALLLLALGLAHSGLGETFLLRHLGRILPLPAVLGGGRGGERVLRAAWHHLTVFAWTFAVILVHDASLSGIGAEERFVVRTISISLLVGAFVWFVGTRAKHLGWALILVIAVLCWVAAG